MKQLKIIKPYLQAFFTDIFFWAYFSGCLTYLLFSFFKVTIPAENMLIFSIIISSVTFGTGISLGRKIFTEEKSSPWYRSFWGISFAFSLLITFIVGWNLVRIDPVKFFSNFRNASGILGGIFDPNFSILLPMLVKLAETIYLALLATIFAIPFAFVLSFFAARNLMGKGLLGNSVYITVRTLATIFRSIEAVVWAIIFSVWVGIGPFAGMLALMIHSIAALTKLYSEQIENIDNGQVEAIRATGASSLQIWMYAVIPQIASPFLAFTIYRWDINVRMATIVGFVGGGGIGLALQQQQQMLQWNNVGVIMWLIAAVVWLMDMVSGKVRKKLQEMQ